MLENRENMQKHCANWGICLDNKKTEYLIALMHAHVPRDVRARLTHAQHTALTMLYLLATDGSCFGEPFFKDVFLRTVLPPEAAQYSAAKYFEHGCSRHERLLQLAMHPRDQMHVECAGVKTWQNFVDSRPEWAAPEAKVVVKGMLLQRVQPKLPGGWLQGPALLLHYVCTRNGSGSGSGSGPTLLDTTRYRLRHARNMHVYLLNDTTDGAGGHPVAFLNKLCPPSTDFLELRHFTFQDVVENMGRYGPAMVPAVALHKEDWALDELMDANCSHHATTNHDVDKNNSHCMLVIGYHPGTQQILLQNWWSDKQFCTCTVSFLHERSARLVWVTSHVTFISGFCPDETCDVSLNAFVVAAHDGPAERYYRTS